MRRAVLYAGFCVLWIALIRFVLSLVPANPAEMLGTTLGLAIGFVLWALVLWRLDDAKP
jgi:hypothetical protein